MEKLCKTYRHTEEYVKFEVEGTETNPFQDLGFSQLTTQINQELMTYMSKMEAFTGQRKQPHYPNTQGIF